ncbi:hypothetical protein C4K46_10170 [Streptococcus oricebi]|uniref:Uncharacterized protein n=1 Tax=Streptococcus oricebi TaxID=1547447 RepID=A0ABS5B649_9STRE|nr:hypothetical protein [Streptococcus oricebi]
MIYLVYECFSFILSEMFVNFHRILVMKANFFGTKNNSLTKDENFLKIDGKSGFFFLSFQTPGRF